jgi:outer membrane protein
VSKSASFWTAAVMTVMAAGTVAPAAAQPPSNEPSPDHVKALIQQAVAQLQDKTPEGQIIPLGQGEGGPRVDLTSDQAVERALERNLTLQSQRLTPRTFDYQLAATRAFYRPMLSSSVSNNSATVLTTRTIEGGQKVNDDSQAWNSGLEQQMPWGGGRFIVNWNNSRLITDRTTSTFNPSFTSRFNAQYTQPLLANFRIDSTRAQLLTQQIQQDVAELDLRGATASTVAQVRNAYWELVFAYQAVEAAQRSLDLASKLVQDNQARVEIGTMAPIDVVQAQAEEATRRQQLVNQQATLRNNELALKRLIVSGTDDELWRATINPVDRPSPVAEPIDLEGAVSNALRNRTDLETSRKDIESANITLRSLRNSALPTLNLVTTYSLDGRGGTALERDRATNAIVNTFPGGYGDALKNLSRFDAPTWTVQLNFNYPVGRSAAEANAARQQILIQQNQVTIKGTELQIATEVTGAALDVRNTLEALRAATTSRELSEKRLEAAQSKFDVGMATNFEVVQAQRDLADARNSELRQLLNYRRALVEFERVQVSPGSPR